ncbi:hypothetical protein OG394_18215 [Kribbella sp. NBC_01245]|uniref:hypothetical protein n=1 Tax=Kribbella sp. NBC_01245 TaxID=2903578 RepID=UPI002E2AD75C|nr:hypothetical protein [Kribbella sp. NBC_01245]
MFALKAVRRGAGAGLLLAVALATVPAHAVAQGAKSAEVVQVVGTVDGFAAPSMHLPGPTEFAVSTTNPKGIRLGLVRLKPGQELSAFLVQLRLALTKHGVEAAAAGREVEATAIMLGGAVTEPGRTATFRRTLVSGTYYLIDYLRVTDAVHALTVAGKAVARSNEPVAPDPALALADRVASIAMVETVSGPRYLAPAVVAGGQSLRVSNRTRQLAEAILIPVKPGTTRQDVQHAFEVIETGNWPPNSPFIGLPQGVPVLTAGQSELVRLSLPPGLYALTTWMVDLKTGRLQAARGMHTLLTVR